MTKPHQMSKLAEEIFQTGNAGLSSSDQKSSAEKVATSSGSIPKKPQDILPYCKGFRTSTASKPEELYNPPFLQPYEMSKLTGKTLNEADMGQKRDKKIDLEQMMTEITEMKKEWDEWVCSQKEDCKKRKEQLEPILVEIDEVQKLQQQVEEELLRARRSTLHKAEKGFSSLEMLKLAIEIGIAGIITGALVALAVVVLSPLSLMATPIIATTAKIGFGVLCAVRASQNGFFSTSINSTEKQDADFTTSDDLANCAP